MGWVLSESPEDLTTQAPPAPQEWPEGVTFDRDESDRIRGFCLERSNPAAAKRRERIGQMQTVMDVLQGQTIKNADSHDWTLEKDGENVILVDKNTGEVFSAGPGEGIRERHLAKMILHSMDCNHATGYAYGEKNANGEEKEPWRDAQILGQALTVHTTRTCPDHVAAIAERSRRKARAAMRRARESLTRAEAWAVKERFNWRHDWRFLTLTMPHMKNADMFKELNRLGIAWELFRKRSDFRIHCRGYIKGIEVSFEKGSPHAHIHSMLHGQFWQIADIRRAWFECVKTATSEVYGIEIEPDPRIEGGIICDMRAVRRKAAASRPIREGEIAEEDALQECLKYLTKPGDLAELAGDVLWAIELRERWERQFEVGGACREKWDGKLYRLEVAALKAARKVADKWAWWGQHARRRHLLDRLEAIKTQLEASTVDPRTLRAEARALRAELAALKEKFRAALAPLVEAKRKAEAELAAYRAERKAEESAKRRSRPSLDTAHISDGQDSDFAPLLAGWEENLELGTLKLPPEPEPEPPPKEPRPPSWRELMHTLDFQTWLNQIVDRWRCALRYRGGMIRARFVGEFVTLEGMDVCQAATF